VQTLTSDSTEKIQELAQRYGMSVEAVQAIWQALSNSNGNAAQFNHPELGGAGQWMRGGMTMVGNLSDATLKGRVDGLCCELSTLMASSGRHTSFQGFQEPTDPLHPPINPDGDPMLTAGSVFGPWWPTELGTPMATGRQNQTRYAYFPDSGRLVIASNGRVTIYNSSAHRIAGVSQQQAQGAPLEFTTPEGIIRAVDLPVISVTEEVQNPTGPVPA
jgi:hypothetical protein